MHQSSTIEFGPATTSSDEFIVTDEGSGVARIRIGNQVGLLNEAESVTGGWSFNTLDTTFSSGILANGGINTTSNANLTLAANGSGDILFDIDADSNIQFNASVVPTLDMLSISNSGYGITADGANGIKLDFVTDAIIGARTNSALNINVTSGATEVNDTLYGINIANITGQTGTEVALNIGSGWDSAIVTNGGNINLGAGYINLSTGNLAFSGTGSITLTGGSISDVTDEVDINDDLAVAGNVSLTGTTGVSMTGVGADITFANLETISNDLNGTITLGRNDSGTVILTSADDDSTAAFSILSGGASALTLDTGGAAALNIGQSNSNSIVIGNTNASTNITLTKGASGNIILNGFNCSTFTNGGTLTANSLGYIECQDDNGGGAGLTYFDSDLGAVYTNNSTYDLLIGGSSTASAKFAFINVNSGIPTASISATTGNAISFDANGNITTTKKQSLILGGGDSGEVQTNSALRIGNGLYGAGLTDCDTSTNKLLWNDASGTFSCGTETGGGGSDIQTSVTAIGNTTLANTSTLLGTVSVTPSTSTGDVIVRLTFSTRSLNATDQTITAQIRSGSNCSGSILASNTTSLTSASGANGPSVAVMYLSTNPGTSSQTYAACGLSSVNNGAGSTGGLISAEVIDTSPSTGGANITVRESDGSPSYSSISLLEFGPGSSSEDDLIVTNPGSGTARVSIGNQIARLLDAETVTGGWTFNTVATTFTTGIVANGGIDTTLNTNLSLAANGTGNIVLTSDFNSGVFIGSVGNTQAPLSVSGGIGGNAAFILNQLNSGDIFTASSSGTTRFTVDNSGNIITLGSLISPVWDGLGATALTIGSNDITSLTIITDSTGDSEVVLPNQSIGAGEIVNDSITSIQLSAALTFSDGDFLDLASILHNDSALQGIRLPQGGSFTNPSSGEGFLAWNTTGAGELQVYNGTSWTGVGGANFDAVYAKSVSDADITMEVNNGSGLIFDLTSSGDFTISDGGTPIAVFEDTGGLTFSPNSTGNFVINVDSNSSVGIGTNNPTATLDVRGANTTNPIATISGNTSGAGLSVDNNGTGDLLSIFKSGAEKFSIDNGGDVTIANLNASNCDVRADGTGTLFCGTEIGADGVTVDVFTSGGTWTKSDYTGLSFALVYVTGAGGGGGGADNGGGADTSNENAGGGGGAGGTTIETLAAASLGSTETVTIGTAGTAGSSAGGNGGAGSSSSFGSLTSANGGSGGNGQTSPNTCSSNATGGSGGAVSSTGDVNLAGNPGRDANCSSENAVGGTGGVSYWGPGGRGGAASALAAVDGDYGIAYGAGGGGGGTVDVASHTSPGGAGAPGAVIVYNYTSSGGDLAEWYETEGNVVEGDLVAISENSYEYDSKLGLQKSSVLKKAAAGDSIIGVVSTVPNTIMGSDVLSNASHPKPIALAGRVPVKVSEENGMIKAGDLLTVSKTPGVAQLSTKAGITIGKALTDSNCEAHTEGACTVLVMVNTTYSSGALIKEALRKQGLSMDAIPGDINVERDISKAILAHLLTRKRKYS